MSLEFGCKVMAASLTYLQSCVNSWIRVLVFSWERSETQVSWRRVVVTVLFFHLACLNRAGVSDAQWSVPEPTVVPE